MNGLCMSGIEWNNFKKPVLTEHHKARSIGDKGFFYNLFVLCLLYLIRNR